MLLQNVSGRARTQGSDIDVIMWLGNNSWSLVSTLLKSRIVDGQVPFTFSVLGIEIELFLTPRETAPTRALAASISRHIQENWDSDTLARYTEDKLAISHLEGKARKLAKIGLAQVYGLPTFHYRASM